MYKKLTEEQINHLKSLEESFNGSILAVTGDHREIEKLVEKNLEPIDLPNEIIKKIQIFEKENDIFLIAVKERNSLYILEAKVAPKQWEKIGLVYPTLDEFSSVYETHDDAHFAKARLKSILGNKKHPELKKWPIRNRKIK